MPESHVAIGVSNLMGYDLPHNFNKPFLAKNIHDFWQRWHMTLSDDEFIKETLENSKDTFI